MNEKLRPHKQSTAHRGGVPPLKDPLGTGALRRALPSTRASKTMAERFGKRLCQLRKERELTQRDLARLLEMDRSFVNEVENGKVGISLDYLEKLAQGFNLSLAELFADL